MNTSIIRTAILTIAAVSVLSCSSGESGRRGNSEAVLEAISSRTSIRSFTDRKVNDATVTALLKAGMAAPTAMNSQPWVFYVIRDKAMMEEISETLPYTKMAKDAALLIVPCGDRERFLSGEGMTYWVQDLSAASENILLAAHAMGLGAVWTGVYPIRERITDVSRILDIEPEHVPLCIIPIGYPAENPAPKDKWNPERVFYR
ncbi:MAG TPA: nitroreductase family protein [Candidatus Coprenecus pullistercoris]|nr:nitroreductase family protein [Candidatus Coprenecus pullistercoris]